MVLNFCHLKLDYSKICIVQLFYSDSQYQSRYIVAKKQAIYSQTLITRSYEGSFYKSESPEVRIKFQTIWYFCIFFSNLNILYIKRRCMSGHTFIHYRVYTRLVGNLDLILARQFKSSTALFYNYINSLCAIKFTKKINNRKT